MSVGSFYKKKTLTKGIDKANQVLKRQKALAVIEEATKKQAANKIGRHSLHSSSDSLSSLFRNYFCSLFIICFMVEVVQLRTSILFCLLHLVKAINCNKLLYFLN